MKQIKSKERVKKFGEVFTPEWVVKDMCDALPDEAWSDITKTFLEPACGNGNFLVEIFDRKLKRCKDVEDALVALASIYGIDIQEDNVVEARHRLLKMLTDKYDDADKYAGEYIMACGILHRNIVQGDFLNPKSVPWLEAACIEAGVSTEPVDLKSKRKKRVKK